MSNIIEKEEEITATFQGASIESGKFEYTGGPVERWVQLVEMNVTTPVTELTEGDAGAKISVGILSVGGGLKEEGTEQNANTVKFTIPVCLPCTIVLEE